MLRSNIAAALLMASAVTTSIIVKRGTCSGFDDSCGPWTLTIDGSSWTMDMDCADGQGNQKHTTIDLNECIGNSWGHLVSGTNFGYTCAHNMEQHPLNPKARNPITVRCEDGQGNQPVSEIELHYIMCNEYGTVRCQNQYDMHLHGL